MRSNPKASSKVNISKTVMENKRFLMLWIFDHGFGNASSGKSNASSLALTKPAFITSFVRADIVLELTAQLCDSRRAQGDAQRSKADIYLQNSFESLII
jgi:hypothetical protein